MRLVSKIPAIGKMIADVGRGFELISLLANISDSIGLPIQGKALFRAENEQQMRIVELKLALELIQNKLATFDTGEWGGDEDYEFGPRGLL